MSKQIRIDQDFFEHLLNCLANQKYIGEAPPNGDALGMGQEKYQELHKSNQQIIDDAWNKGMSLLLAQPDPEEEKG